MRPRPIAVLLLLSATALVGVAAAPAAAAPRCTITGTASDDTLRGTSGRDVVCGLGGDDRLVGRAGGDVLRGGPGADRLDGGPGADRLAGGPGSDAVKLDDGDTLDDDRDSTTIVPPGDYTRTTDVYFRGFEGVKVTASQGDPSSCTKDESYGTFTPTGSGEHWRPLTMTVKSGGSCAFESSYNTWKFSWPGGSGQMEVHQFGDGRWDSWCHAGWTAPVTCVKDGPNLYVTKHAGAAEAGTPEPIAPELGDWTVSASVTFDNFQGIEVTSSQGQPTNCTRDEGYGTFTPTDLNQAVRLVATVKDGGSCFIQKSYNTWEFKWSNGAGRVKVTYSGSSYDLDCMHGRGSKIENVSCQERAGGVHFVRRS